MFTVRTDGLTLAMETKRGDFSFIKATCTGNESRKVSTCQGNRNTNQRIAVLGEGHMKPDDLHRYITEHMRMSHVYQPVMLRELLKSDGAATVCLLYTSPSPRD